MFKKLYFALVIGVLLATSSCVRYKSVVYMNDRFSVKDSANTQIVTAQDRQIILHPGDNIFINVMGPNVNELGLFTRSNDDATVQGNSYLQGYIIDPVGDVNFPVTGKVQLAGLTLEQAQKRLQEKVNEYITNAVVDVRLLSFTITVLGEVNRPGPYQFIDQNVNLLDVLGKAGDCNPYGDKKSIMVIRKDGDKTITAMVNIHDSGFISNPYFWLKPNDVVYIKPLKAKMLQVNAPFWNIVLSSISTISTILLYTAYLKY